MGLSRKALPVWMLTIISLMCTVIVDQGEGGA